MIRLPLVPIAAPTSNLPARRAHLLGSRSSNSYRGFLLVLSLSLLSSPGSTRANSTFGEDLIFADGFESGDASGWSLAVPPVPPAEGFSFCEDFESGSLDPAFWQATPAADDGLVEVLTSIEGIDASHQGIFGLAMGRSTNGSLVTNTLDLHLDLSGRDQLDLSYWIQDAGDETHNEDGIFLSDDGGKFFQKVVDFDPGNWISFVYGFLPPLDLDQVAANLGLSLNDQFVIRFQQHDNDDFNFDGLMLDDIKVIDPRQTPAELPFLDDFESGGLGAAWRHGDPTNTAPTDSIKPGGLVEVASSISGLEIAHQGLFGVALGRRVNGGLTANALDLHLNLVGESDVELRFWLQDTGDETHSLDGLYLSNDGGRFFTKVYDFDPSDWSNYVYGQLPPIDIARLAADEGLALTGDFVIRFQQYDNDDFNFDGLTIDDVEVLAEPTVYASLPFSDGFESGQLSQPWAWADPLRPTATVPSGTVRPGGLVEVLSSIEGNEAAHLGNFGLALGRRVNGSLTANAVDLYLDLGATSQVELRFWLKDANDETHEQDGVYFSSNGGEIFRKAFDFEPSAYTDDLYQEMVLDVDELATGLGLALTDEFVIRFQQYDNDNFVFDGLFIDDVSVTTDP